MPKVSVIIPVYNVEPYLKQCLDSVVNQTLRDIEIICVNDGSTDNCPKILEEYASTDNRIIILNNKTNIGQGESRNNALKIARGKYIMFLDSDDWFESNACEVAYNQVSKNHNDYCLFNYYSYKDKYLSKSICLTKYVEYKSLKYSYNLNPYTDNIPYCGSCERKIYSNKFLKDNNCNFISGKYGEDHLFALQVGLYGKSVSTIEQPLVNTRFFEDDANDYRRKIIKDRNNSYLDFFKNMSIFVDLFKSNSKADAYKRYTAIHFINIVLKYFDYHMCNSAYKKEEMYSIVRNIFIDLNDYLKKSVLFYEIVYKIPAEENLLKNTNQNSIITTDTEFIRIKKISKDNLKKYNRILMYKNLHEYNFFIKFLPHIFSIKNNYRNNQKHKIITILGLKIKLKIAKQKESK